MNNLKAKLTKMNPKKGFCNLLLCFIIFCIVAGIGTIAKFGSRIPEIRQQIQTIENAHEEQVDNFIQEGSQHENDYKKHHEIDWENIITFKTSDYIFIGCVIAVLWIILGIYWLYTTAYVVSKAWEVGANAWIFDVLTLVTNLFGVACLWIYIKMFHVCPHCGKLQPRKANNCALCGTAMYIRCPECAARVSNKDKYCNGCGRKMHNQ